MPGVIYCYEVVVVVGSSSYFANKHSTDPGHPVLWRPYLILARSAVDSELHPPPRQDNTHLASSTTAPLNTLTLYAYSRPFLQIPKS